MKKAGRWSDGWAFCKKNPAFTLVLVCELIGLLWLSASLLARPVAFQLTAQEIDTPAFGSFADDSQTAEVNIGEHIPASGAFVIEIFYRSEKETELSRKSLYEEVGYCEAYSASNPSAVRMDAFSMDHAHGVVSQRMWLVFGAPEDLTLRFTALQARISVEEIRVTEQTVWRWVRLLGVLTLMLLADACYVCFFAAGTPRGAKDEERKRTALLLGAITLLASLPVFADFLYQGHDLPFHIERLALIAEEWGYGQFPVRMQTGALNGYGYASSLFYCDLFLYPFALLYRCMVPLHTCYQLYVLFFNGLTALLSYRCFRRMAQSRNVSLLGTALYVLSVYRLTNLYLRAAVGEYTAMAFFPLVALGMFSILKEDKPTLRDWMPLALGMAGVLQSHLLSAEIAAGFLALYGVVHLSRLMRWSSIRALFGAATTACGLSLWFLLPLIESMLTMSVGATASVGKIQDHGTYLVQLLGILPPGTGGSEFYVGGMRNEMALGVGLALLIGMGVSLYCFSKRRQWTLETEKAYQQMRSVFLIAMLAMGLTLRIFPWDALESVVGAAPAKLLSAMQFPWRLLGACTLLFTVTTMLSLRLLSVRRSDWARRCAWLMIGALLLNAGYFYLDFTNHVKEAPYRSATLRSTMDVGSYDYVLTGADVIEARYAYVQTGKTVTADGYQKKNGEATVYCVNDGAEESFAILPLWAYRNYRAYDVETGKELSVTMAGNGKVQVWLAPGYRGTVAVRYAPPALWRAAEGISLAVFAWVVLLFWKERRTCPNTRTL